MGAAFSIHLARRQAPEHKVLADDSIVVCSFGDASANHSTAQGAINTLAGLAIRISQCRSYWFVKTMGLVFQYALPKVGLRLIISSAPACSISHANGLDMLATYQAAHQAADYVRKTRKPAFLHLDMVRLYGHAGSDVQTAYLSQAECEAWEANDPLLYSASLLFSNSYAAHKPFWIYMRRLMRNAQLQR